MTNPISIILDEAADPQEGVRPGGLSSLRDEAADASSPKASIPDAELLRQAREIAASVFERMSANHPDRDHVNAYAGFMRSGAYDCDRDVQIALAALQGADRCRNCDGKGWVCENHRDRPWGGLSDSRDACECGAGSPCGVCNLEAAAAGITDPMWRALKTIVEFETTQAMDFLTTAERLEVSIDEIKQIAAQGIAARSDETLQAAQPEGQEPDPKDAPEDPSAHRTAAKQAGEA